MDENVVEISRNDITIPESRKELEDKILKLSKECGIKIVANDLMCWLDFLCQLEDFISSQSLNNTNKTKNG